VNSGKNNDYSTNNAENEQKITGKIIGKLVEHNIQAKETRNLTTSAKKLYTVCPCRIFLMTYSL